MREQICDPKHSTCELYWDTWHHRVKVVAIINWCQLYNITISKFIQQL